MSRQIQKYQSFLAVCLGDTPTSIWEGKSLREIHAKCKISEKDYWDFMEEFKKSLLEVDITETLALQIIQHINTCFKNEVLNK